MPMMQAVQVSAPGAAFELVERPIPNPGAGELLIKVEACGICHGDAATKEARYAAIALPRVPGHEVVGRVVKASSPSAAFAVGQRVGVGYRGGYCRRCDACRRGDFHACRNPLTTGQSMDGGYAEYMTVQEEAVVTIPDGITAAEAAPLLCAGRTTYSALQAGGAKRGDLVAIQGIGGLGHLAIQYAARLGCRTVALSRGLISGHWRKERVVANEFRTRSPRFMGGNIDRNLALVEALRKIANAKGVSVAQIAIAWVAAQSNDIVPLVGARRLDLLTESLGSFDVALTPEDLAAIETTVSKGAAAGDRYAPVGMATLDSERARQT
jgi:NADPH:quinone reductase-like Zn-dependent oxidoreductase